MVKQEWTYCYEISRNLFLALCRKEVESMIEKKISGGMEGKGSKISELVCAGSYPCTVN